MSVAIVESATCSAPQSSYAAQPLPGQRADRFSSPFHLQDQSSHFPVRNDGAFTSQSQAVASPPVPTRHERLASELAFLASQHHDSDYNHAKYGPQACPFQYVPLSILQPEVFAELRARQARAQQCIPWVRTSLDPNSARAQTQDGLGRQVAGGHPIRLGPSGTTTPNAHAVQERITAALTEQICPVPALGDSNVQTPMRGRPGCPPDANEPSPPFKNSHTHPINVSPIIPPELIPIISSHIFLTSPCLGADPEDSPYEYNHVVDGSSSTRMICEISSAFQLDHLLANHILYRHNGGEAHLSNRHSFRQASNHNRSRPSGQAYAPDIPQPAYIPYPPTRADVTEALHAALHCSISDGAASGASPYPTVMVTPNLSKRKFEASSPPGEASLKRLSTHHLNPSVVSLSLEPDDDMQSRRARFSPFALPFTPSHCIPQEASTSIPISGLSASVSEEAEEEKDESPTSTSTSDSERLSPPLPANSFVLGNLFLSSCPGKKVRLSGPVRGRNGVCRELAVDLRRMKNLGVECVVCCLDDEELSFLGSPWTEYEKVARDIELDVLRIPMPEGLAPMSLALANEYVTRLIYTYTLRGMSVLVHCRGGVGRAGVIACCWLLKLGLCGSLPDSGGDAPDWDLGSADNAMLVLTRPLSNLADPRPASPDVACTVEVMRGLDPTSQMRLVRRSVVDMVSRVIALVRRRRSIKAIETFEQVLFLVEYVEYLNGRRELAV